MSDKRPPINFKEIEELVARVRGTTNAQAALFPGASRYNVSANLDPDAEYKKQERVLALEHRKVSNDLRIKLKKSELRTKRQKVAFRKVFSQRLYKLLFWQLIFASVFLVVSTNTFYKVFDVSENLMLGFFASITVNVIGLFTVVVKNIFPSSGE